MFKNGGFKTKFGKQRQKKNQPSRVPNFKEFVLNVGPSYIDFEMLKRPILTFIQVEGSTTFHGS